MCCYYGINNSFNEKSYFSTYAPGSAVAAESLVGSVTLRDNPVGAMGSLAAWFQNVLFFTTGSTNAVSRAQPWLRLAEASVAPPVTVAAPFTASAPVTVVSARLPPTESKPPCVMPAPPDNDMLLPDDSAPVAASEPVAVAPSVPPAVSDRALFAAFGVLLLDFRSLKLALLAMLPPVVGTALLFGVMGRFHLDLNPANMIVLPEGRGLTWPQEIDYSAEWLRKQAFPFGLPG